MHPDLVFPDQSVQSVPESNGALHSGPLSRMTELEA